MNASSPPPTMEPLSARIPSDLYLWLAQLQVEGATTNSDKLRVLLGQLKRQHDGAFDYVAAHAWTRDLTARLREALVRIESETGQLATATLKQVVKQTRQRLRVLKPETVASLLASHRNR